MYVTFSDRGLWPVLFHRLEPYSSTFQLAGICVCQPKIPPLPNSSNGQKHSFGYGLGKSRSARDRHRQQQKVDLLQSWLQKLVEKPSDLIPSAFFNLVHLPKQQHQYRCASHQQITYGNRLPWLPCLVAAYSAHLVAPSFCLTPVIQWWDCPPIPIPLLLL